MANRRALSVKQRSEGLMRKMRAAGRPADRPKPPEIPIPFAGRRSPRSREQIGAPVRPVNLVCVLSQTGRLLLLRRARAGGAARLRIYGTHLD